MALSILVQQKFLCTRDQVWQLGVHEPRNDVELFDGPYNVRPVSLEVLSWSHVRLTLKCRAVFATAGEDGLANSLPYIDDAKRIRIEYLISWQSLVQKVHATLPQRVSVRLEISQGNWCAERDLERQRG